LRVLGGSKFIHIHKVGCHLPPCRAAVAVVGVPGWSGDERAAEELKKRWGRNQFKINLRRQRAIKKKCGFSAISYVNIFPANVLFKG